MPTPLPHPPILTADGSYDIEGLVPGHEHLLTFKGSFGGGTLTLQCYNDANGTFENVDGASWDGTGDTETRYVSPSRKSRLILSGATSTPAIGITHIPLHHS